MKQFLRECLKPAQVSIAFLCISGGVTVLQLRPWLVGTAAKAEGAVDKAGRAMGNLDDASKSLKAAADSQVNSIGTLGGKINGTIDSANAAISNLGGVAGNVVTLAQHATATVDAATKTLSALQADLEALKKPIENLAPIEAQVTETIPEVKLAFVNLNALATDGDIKKTIGNVQGMTHSGNSILGDLADESHKLIHPDKKKLTFWGAIEGGMLWWHSHNPLPPIY